MPTALSKSVSSWSCPLFSANHLRYGTSRKISYLRGVRYSPHFSTNPPLATTLCCPQLNLEQRLLPAERRRFTCASAFACTRHGKPSHVEQRMRPAGRAPQAALVPGRDTNRKVPYVPASRQPSPPRHATRMFLWWTGQSRLRYRAH